jgi:hypothetical protein
VHQVARVPVGALQFLNDSGTVDEVSVLPERILGQTRTVSAVRSDGFLPLAQGKRRGSGLAVCIASLIQRNVALLLKGFNEDLTPARNQIINSSPVPGNADDFRETTAGSHRFFIRCEFNCLAIGGHATRRTEHELCEAVDVLRSGRLAALSSALRVKIPRFFSVLGGFG